MAGAADATFHRPPRAWPDPPPAEPLRMHAPPPKPEPPTGGMMYAAMPAMGSFGLIAFAFVYDNPLFIYIGVGMAFLAVLLVIGIRWSQKRSVRKKRQRNRRRYYDYLSQTERQLSHDANLQLAAADRLYPDHERLWGLVLGRRHLWERRAADPDFLEVRLGRGAVDHSRSIVLELGDDPLTERETDLEEQASTVRKRWQRVNDLPVCVDLAAAQVLSITGPPAAGRALARSLASQLAAFRAPRDLRLLAAFSPEEAAEWEWMKWLPHARSHAPPRKGSNAPGAPAVMLADSTDHLGALLDAELGPRIEQLQRIEEEGPTARRTRLGAPRLVVFIDGYAPDAAVARLASVRDAMDRGERLEVTLVTLCDAPEREPSEADVRIELSAGAVATVEQRGREERRRTEGVWPDQADAGLCEAIARSLAPLRLEDRYADHGVADEMRLLDLLEYASPDRIDVARAWGPRSPRERLRTPIGVSVSGEPLALDLKEAAQGGQGPHGLIVGATGSGKSELMRTLVAGLALRHSPEELAFVLIDYKGGSAFAELSRLPHTAGLITNLQRDEALVDRMRDALLGEQERRQSMLRDAGDLDDIGAYRAARERDPSLPSMPELLVIVDEFGELLSARSEFIDLFLGIGRVGRSLGMHLLFSTQRLEEGKLRGLEANLRYRLCLRTYSTTESKIVLGTPDAYLLPPYPGAAYLKVDTGTYERLKVALISTPTPRAPDAVEAVGRVESFSAAPPPAASGETEDGVPLHGEGPTELEQVVRLLGEAHGGSVHQVWVAPLASELSLAEVVQEAPWWERSERARGLAAPIGMVDVPAEQRTQPLVLDFEGSAGHLALIGAPQSGKSTFLRTLATSLMLRHRPDEVRLYVVDLAGGALAGLAGAPHVSGVAAKAQPDRVRQTVRHLRALVAGREDAFRRLGLGSMRAARDARAAGELEGEDLADVFLLVDGWSVLRHDFEGLEQELEQLGAEGLNFGVHLVAAANRWGEIRPNLSDNIGGRLELRLNDPLDSEHRGRLAETVPTDTPGRGLSSDGLHFQTALDDPAAPEQAARSWEGPAAPPVPLLPERLDWSDLPREEQEPGVSIGVEELDLQPVRLDLTTGDPHFLVLGDGESGKSNLLRLFARALLEDQDPGRAQLTVIDYRRSLLDLADATHIRAYAVNAAMTTQAVGELRAELGQRLAGSGAGGEELMRAPSWTGPRHYVLIDDYDLVPSATENPLLGLVDLLAQGRDVGLHVVLARRVGGVLRSSFGGDPFYQRLVELRSPGLLMSGDREEGNVLGGLRAQQLPPGRGMLISRQGKPSLVQTALAPPPDEPERAPERSEPRRLHG